MLLINSEGGGWEDSVKSMSKVRMLLCINHILEGKQVGSMQ